MKRLLKGLRTFIRALPLFFIFELAYKMLLVAVGVPVVTLLLRVNVKLTGVGFISDESLYVYLTHPVTIFTILIMLFCVGFFSFIELTALTACFSCVSQGEKITVGGMFRTGVKSFGQAFRGTGILNVLVFMLCMPVAQFTISSGVFFAPVMPILRRIFLNISSGAAVAVYILLMILFTMFFAGRSYSLHYLVLTNKRFPECIKMSREKLNGKRSRMALSLVVYSLLIAGIIAAAVLLISFMIVLVIRGFSRPEKALRSALRVLRYTWRIIYAMSSFFSAPMLFSWLTEQFNTDTEGDRAGFTVPDSEHRSRGKGRSKYIALCVIAAAVGANIIYARAVYKGNIRRVAGFMGQTQISAHRGNSSAAPENTYYAFEAAIDSGADYIELDVQMTKDGQLVVFHDKKLDRTTNGKGVLTNYTYDELQQLSAGAWFGKTGEFADAKIMLLSEVLDEFAGKILFNIEIKDHGDTSAAAEETVALIEEYGIVSSCYVTSFSYRILRQVKELDPHIKTAMIANFSTATAYSQLKYIDAVSMNYAFVNQSMVNSAHMNGKKVFVWTVDRQADMEQMLALGVDNIITNRPEKAAEVVYSRSVSDMVLTVLNAIFGNS